MVTRGRSQTGCIGFPPGPVQRVGRPITPWWTMKRPSDRLLSSVLIVVSCILVSLITSFPMADCCDFWRFSHRVGATTPEFDSRGPAGILRCRDEVNKAIDSASTFYGEV